MLDRRNHVLEQLGRVFRERSADVVDAALPAEMRSLVLKLPTAEPRRVRAGDPSVASQEDVAPADPRPATPSHPK